MIFQRKIPKVNELRVTVVDGECFGMFVDTSNLGDSETDIRKLNYTNEKMRFSGGPVPDDVTKSSVRLMEIFGLSYAGIDWVQDANGEWYFLELNCMGSFKWSEICGAGSITDSIASALIRRSQND